MNLEGYFEGSNGRVRGVSGAYASRTTVGALKLLDGLNFHFFSLMKDWWYIFFITIELWAASAWTNHLQTKYLEI